MIRIVGNFFTVTRRVLVRPPPILPKMSPIDDRAHLRARHAGNFEHRHAAAGLPPPRSRFPCRRARQCGAACGSFLGRGAGARADQRIEHALLGGLLGARLHFLALPLACQRDADLDQIAHDLLDVAADIADLGEFGRFDLDEWRAGEPASRREISVLPTPVGPDHQDVFRQHFLAQLVVELQPAPAVAERDGDGALGVGLADDVAIELGNDFAGGEVGHALRTIRARGRPASRPCGPVQSRPFHRPGSRARWRDRDRSRCAAFLRQQALGEGADERRAVAAAEHVGLADELVEAARAGRLRAEADIPGAQVVALQIGKRTRRPPPR